MVKKERILFGLLGIAAVILILQTKIPFNVENEIVLSEEEMKADILQLKNDFTRFHPDSKKEDQYNTFFIELNDMITEDKSVSEFSVILANKMAELNDSHTSVVPEKSGPTIPLILKFIDNEYFALNSVSDIKPGDKIISIGGIKIEDIYNYYSLQYSSENIFWKRECFEEIFIEANKIIELGGRKTFLGGLKIIYQSNEKTCSITLYKKDFIDRQYNDHERNEILYDRSDNVNFVLSKSSNYNYKVNSDIGYILFEIRSCMYTSEYTQVTDEVFSLLNENKFSNLVIDLRGNVGGTSEVVDYLRTRLEAYNRYLYRQNETTNNEVNVLVLVDHKTFSAAVDFACNMKSFYNGVIIGQPTGGTIPCNGDSEFLELNNSDIFYAISKKYYSEYDGVKSYLDAIYPDYLSSYDIFDYINGNDKDLIIAEDQIRNKLSDKK